MDRTKSNSLYFARVINIKVFFFPGEGRNKFHVVQYKFIHTNLPFSKFMFRKYLSLFSGLLRESMEDEDKSIMLEIMELHLIEYIFQTSANKKKDILLCCLDLLHFSSILTY